jgi:hypothetical protein
MAESLSLRDISVGSAEIFSGYLGESAMRTVFEAGLGYQDMMKVN